MRKRIIKTSDILSEALKIKKANRKSATHFVLCNGNEIRYLIDLNGGKQKLRKNIAAYSDRLELLMTVINFLPFSFLEICGTGYFSSISLHTILDKQYKSLKADGWNMIVGTYDEKQKLVLQCFGESLPHGLFIKVGNATTEVEMQSEIEFLSKKHNYKTFTIPELIKSECRNKKNPFNVQITKEFTGKKVAPILTKEIVQICREISESSLMMEGKEYTFSHGDFAPWNLKKNEENYVVFDWEHCGMRMRWFDLMHYVVICKEKLYGKEFSKAFNEGIIEIQKFIKDFSIDRWDFEKEYKKIHPK